MDEGNLLSTAQVALWLGVHQKTVYNLIRTDNLPAIRVGGCWRFTEESITRYIQARKQNHG